MTRYAKKGDQIESTVKTTKDGKQQPGGEDVRIDIDKGDRLTVVVDDPDSGFVFAEINKGDGPVIVNLCPNEYKFV